MHVLGTLCFIQNTLDHTYTVTYCTLLLKFDNLRALEQLRLQPNDTCSPQIFRMQYIHKWWSDCFQIWYRGEVSEATWKKLSMTTGRLTPKLHSLTTLLYPLNLQNAISPQVMVRLLSNFIQRWSIWNYIKNLSMTRLTPKLHSWWHFCIPQFFEM